MTLVLRLGSSHREKQQSLILNHSNIEEFKLKKINSIKGLNKKLQSK